jgi:hypothetical protein
LVESANEQLDILEYKGQLSSIKFSSALALKMANHKLAEVRKFVARVLPAQASEGFLFDPSQSVRNAAAKKASLQTLEEATKKFPKDLGLKDLLEERILSESSALESAATSPYEDMLSEEWYDRVARKLIQDYGKTIDTTWKSSAVKQFCSSARATTRLPVDSSKLMKKMDDLIATYESNRAKELGLNESIQILIEESDVEDPIDDLISEDLSPQEFISRCDSILGVRYAVLPRAIMKYKIQEGLSLNKIPVSCKLPHGSAPRRIDEIALDSYVKHWNDKQKMSGEPFELRWDVHPESMDKITFKLELK